jgi:hypothetical protein
MAVSFSDKDLAMYLYGNGLTPERREQIEEAYFRDDRVLRRIEELELELVEAYVSGQLTGSEKRSVSRLIQRSDKLAEHAGFMNALRTITLRRAQRRPLLRRILGIFCTPMPFWLSASATISCLLIAFIGAIFTYTLVRTRLVNNASMPYVRPSTTQDAPLDVGGAVTLRRTTDLIRFVLPETVSHCADVAISISNPVRHETVPNRHITIVLQSAFVPRGHISVILDANLLSPGVWVMSVSAKCGGRSSKSTDYQITVVQ